jgi:Domain of unknown function (DUF5615)
MPWVNIEASVNANPPSEREKREVLDYMGRRAKPRFYADENFPAIAAEILRSIGADVLTVQTARQIGHPDENHAANALRLGRVLITCDRDYLDDRRFPLVHCPALVVCDFGSGSRADVLSVFDCLTGIFKAPQFYDRWVKIDAKRKCWTECSRFQDGSTLRARYRLSKGGLQEWLEPPETG